MALLAEAVANGDEEALKAVPAPIFAGYMQQAQSFADELGIFDVSGYASALLEGEDQARLIKAVISNDRQTAQVILEKATESLHEMSQDPETIAELTRNGFSIEGTGPNAVITFPNGAQMSFLQAYRDGHFSS